MWLYILHYAEAIHHTQHYCGQTPDPLRRFQSHAGGAGSALTAEFAHRGIRFQVGMLAQCSQSKASQFERGLKNSKNLASYCEHCCKANGEIPSIWKGAQRYPCPELASIKWKSNVVRPCYISKATSVEELDTLQQSHGDHSVGYLNWNALQEAIDAARVRTITVDSTLAGYVINTAKRRDGTITIQQVIVHRDYRGECYGKALIEHLAVENPGSAMHCHVRSDLPANLFWEAIGFVRLRTKTHKTSGRTLVEYHRPCFLHFNRKEIEK